MKRKVKKYLIPNENNEYKPHIFRGSSIVALIGLFILVLIFSISTTLVVNNSNLLGAIFPSVLVDLANEARVEENFKPLSVNEKLTQAAQMKANDMAEKGYFSHNSPSG